MQPIEKLETRPDDDEVGGRPAPHPEHKFELWSAETGPRLASRRLAVAVQVQLALARVQILDAKRALRAAEMDLERARTLGIGVGRPRP